MQIDNNGEYIPNLLLIAPGPKHDPVGFYRSRAEALSKSYQGVIFTSSPVITHQSISRFDIISKRYFSNGPLEFLSFLWAAHKFERRASRENEKFDLIVVYDPLSSGLLGLMLKKRLGAKLAVEINGIYDDANNFADIKNPLLKKIKTKLYPRVVKSVVKKANGIKLLFDGQADGFLSGQAHLPVISRFANLVDIDSFYANQADINKKNDSVCGLPTFSQGSRLSYRRFYDGGRGLPRLEVNYYRVVCGQKCYRFRIGGYPKY